jgi:histidinol-phosphate aminotransferase
MTPLPADAIPRWIRSVDPYLPGKPVRDIESEIGRRAAQLASNENALGPSPKAIEGARRALAEGNRYTEGGDKYLREALAARHGVAFENIILGAGSSELITFAARALLGPGRVGATSESAFPLYAINIKLTGADLCAIPLRQYAIDLEPLAASLPETTKAIFLANPNNPTGTMFTVDQFESFLAKIPSHVLVVLDEAYAEYVDRSDYSRSIELVREGRNVLVLRTFSKVFGLAGLRIGYGIGDAALLQELDKLRAPYNTSSMAEAAALAALDDTEHVARSVESNRAGLAQLERALDELAVHHVPSFANFVLVNLGREAKPIAAQLEACGVLVRPLGFMGLPNAIRVTVGTEDDNANFLNAFGKIVGEKRDAKSKSESREPR